jgi:Protein of unknown function DUF72
VKSEMDGPSEAIVPAKEERRLKREVRRSKQRQENVGRAARMHKARLAWECETKQGTPHFINPSLPQVNVGCSGWFYWHWRGEFYPANLSTAAWFTHYAAHFKTVELNAPFYSWPTTANVRTWVRQVGRRKFCLYGQGLRTHHPRQTFYRNEDARPRLRPYWRPARSSNGLFSLSTSAQLSLHASPP